MTKSISNFLILLIVLTVYQNKAQINGEIFGKKEDFKKMAQRPLIVELLVENQDELRKLNKKENANKLVSDYKNFIKKYNELIQITVHKYWKFNLLIEYKTEVEVAALKNAKSNKYTLLSYIEMRDEVKSPNEETDFTIPALKLTKIESHENKPEYKIYLPSTYIRSDKKYLEADFRVALHAMQENIKFAMKMNENIEFQDFVFEMTLKNCTKLKRVSVMVEKNMMHQDLDEAKVKKVCEAKIEWVEQGDIENHMFNKTKGKAALFAIPFTVLRGGSSSKPIFSVAFFKIVVDCETGVILWSNDNDMGNITYDKNPSRFMIERDFKNLAPCKS